MFAKRMIDRMNLFILMMCFTGNQINVIWHLVNRIHSNYYYKHVKEFPIQWYMYTKGKYVLPIIHMVH